MASARRRPRRAARLADAKPERGRWSPRTARGRGGACLCRIQREGDVAFSMSLRRNRHDWNRSARWIATDGHQTCPAFGCHQQVPISHKVDWKLSGGESQQAVGSGVWIVATEPIRVVDGAAPTREAGGHETDALDA